MKRPPKAITILGKRWVRRYTRLSGHYGKCDPPWKRGKEILIDERNDERERLYALIHETLHAAFWWLDEEYVVQYAWDLADLLMAEGYRCETEAQ